MLNHALFHQLTKFGHQVGKVTYILKSNVKVLAELYEKSMSEAYFLSLCASLAHISPTRLPLIKGYALTMNYVYKQVSSLYQTMQNILIEFL